ncbi:MAG: ethanolamine ammonia-lyase reactivating factor EutA [Chloroflexi bacterium]|nr:ethanolamine ammonia-lyase reactivating factor EutA [Chloroflexota bacterium]
MTHEHSGNAHAHSGFAGVHSHDGGAPHWHDEFGEHLYEDLSPEEFAARQLDWQKHNVQIVTVGIDIGSSTTHVMFSKIYLQLVGEAPDVRGVVVARQILWQSPIWLTPYLSDNTIDIEALDAYCAEAYQAVEATRNEIDSGVVILTGEALKRVNARSIARMFAAEAGKFVCASAGHHMEAVLAANGSATVARSRRDKRTLLNIDIGGGTTKFALVRDGVVEATAAVAIGARVVARDEDGRLTRIDEPARLVAEELGISLTLGEALEQADENRIVRAWTDMLVSIVKLEPPTGLVAKLMLTDPLPTHLPPRALTFSGGVAEFIYEREEQDFGDLGQPLAKAIRQALNRNRFGLPSLVHPSLGIRATAVGASQFNVQGGVNAYVPDESFLPLYNVPVLVPRIDLEGDVPSETIAASIHDALTRADIVEGEQPLALAFRILSDEPRPSLLHALAEGIRAALPHTIAGAAPLVLVVNQGVSNTFVRPSTDAHALSAHRPAVAVGSRLKEELGAACHTIAMENVHLAEFDFIDVAPVLRPSEVVPVTVKSLLFAGGLDRRSVKQALIDAALGR